MIQPDKIIRSARRTLAVSIDAFGNVTVRAPYRCAEERIFAFLQEKEGWIARKKSERAGAGMRLPPENLDGYVFSLIGKDCTICLFDETRIRFDEQNQRLFLPREKAKARLIVWLKDNAKRIFTQLTAQKAQEMGVRYKSVGVSSAKTRWGSCTAENAIRYTYRLLYAPKEIIEYVITHELAHVRHKNHSAAFWREVERYCPDCKQKRKRLKAQGFWMEIF